MKSPWRLLTGFVLITYLFFLVLPMALLAAIHGLTVLIPSPDFPPKPYHEPVAAAVFVFGWYWVASSNLMLMKRGQGTSLEVAGHGVALTRSLVTQGVYGRVRNPMVFGYFVSFGLGLAVLQRSLPGLLVCPLALLLYGAYLKRWEEHGLRDRFGDDYARYCAHVPRLVPVPGRRFPQFPREGEG
jgi:protein-S-isoprenylcysteine O-methyltransferase Ste14